MPKPWAQSYSALAREKPSQQKQIGQPATFACGIAQPSRRIRSVWTGRRLIGCQAYLTSDVLTISSLITYCQIGERKRVRTWFRRRRRRSRCATEKGSSMTSALILKPRLSRFNLTRPQRLQAIARQAPEPVYAREPPPLGLASGSTIRMRSTLRSAWRSAFALAAITLGASISGCAVGPDYETPAMSLSSFHSVGGVLTRGNNSPPPLDTWWTGFNDPTLTRIIRRALEQNLDLAASLARVEQARAAAQEAGAQLLPTSNLTGQTTEIPPVARKSHRGHWKELARL